MSAALPPVPDLIPISALRKGSQRSSSSASSSSDYCHTGSTGSTTGSRYADSDSCSSSGSSSTPAAHLQLVPADDECEDEEQEDEDEDEVRGRAAVEVMGEQRSRRTKHATAAASDVIDTPPRWSRGRHGAAPGASRKSERHRKSDRRRDRDRDRERRKRSNSKSKLPNANAALATPSRSPPPPPPPPPPTTTTTTTTAASPRVNPIFVWVRQQDTHIVEVKCEDYDKRNRILLTKTAQGWRAIPRTETLAPALQKDDASTPTTTTTGAAAAAAAAAAAVAQASGSGKHCRKAKKRSSGSKPPKRKSFGVQVDEDDLLLLAEDASASAWSGDDSEVVALESSSSSPTPSPADVNNRECVPDISASDGGGGGGGEGGGGGGRGCRASARDECQSNISPLDNLLAVAELEFNQQIEAERWETSNNNNNNNNNNNHNGKTNVQEDLDMFIESCNAPPAGARDDKSKAQEDCDCDYNEEDDNNIGMDDILSRLEQSLRSPDSLHNDIDMIIKEDLEHLGQADEAAEEVEERLPDVCEVQAEMKMTADDAPMVIDSSTEVGVADKAAPEASRLHPVDVEDEISASVIGHPPALTSELPAADEGKRPDADLQPTDLSVQATQSCEDLVPTDLSIPKCLASPLSKRPPSQNSETIQSPQPSGIPAVPPSPDLLYSANKNTSKSNIYLESLLSPTKPDAVVTADKEPLNLGAMRDCESPKVTCSQEEPPSKRVKIEDITLKALLDKEQKAQMRAATKQIDTPKLLELLSSHEDDEEMMEHEPLAQMKQVLLNATLNIPDPMLIPKDRLSQILASPAREIPKLLKLRPELRLPEALAYPHLLQDPDILVITLAQLQMIIEKQSQSLPLVEKEKAHSERADRRRACQQEGCNKGKEKEGRERVRLTIPDPSAHQQVARKPTPTPPPPKEKPALRDRDAGGKPKKGAEPANNDLDAATNAAFSQMLWLPYLNQLEAMNNPDFLKFLATMLPSYPPDMTHMMRPFPPPAFPVPQAPLNYSPLELSMWQEMMLQARTKSQFDLLGTQKLFAKSTLGALPPYATPAFALQPRPMAAQYQQPSMPKYASKTKATAAGSYQQQQQHQQSTPMKDGPSLSYHHPHREPTGHHGYEQHLQRQKQQQALHHQQQQGLLKHQQDLLKQQQQQQEMYSKPKVACKPFANLVQPNLQGLQTFASLSPSPSALQQQQQQLHHQQIEHYRQYQQLQQHQQHEKRNRSTSHGHPQQGQAQSQGPIDLSGAAACPMAGKLKVKQAEHLVDPKRLRKYDEIAEVGSTTTSIDEVHDPQKHLWHPLFGNQKSYTSPWSWTTVTATGE